jgi:hypothetical protein
LIGVRDKRGESLLPFRVRQDDELLELVEDDEEPAVSSLRQNFEQTAQIWGLSQFPLPRASKLHDRVAERRLGVLPDARLYDGPARVPKRREHEGAFRTELFPEPESPVR